ncbi:hypothetical protein [Streptomyces lydicus]|uniref:hypothetical protein n=1 Tax=Streptomyces lydicus TaxID=47763 RepID=UPI003790050A
MSTPRPAPPTAAPPSPAGPRSGLAHHAIGTGELVFFVVAAAAPLTVTAGAAPVAIGMAGPAAPLGYLLSGVLLIVFAAGFTAMSRYVRNAGAFYAYVGRGLGRATGVGAAYVALLSYNAIEVGLLAGLGRFAESALVDLTGLHLAWWVWALAGLVAIGGLGIMLLQALAALAVVGFFRRDRRGLPAWRVVAAPLAACAGLAVLLVLVCRHFALLTNAPAGVNLALLVPLPLVFALGLAVALRIRRRAPEAYDRLTTVDAERG